MKCEHSHYYRDDGFDVMGHLAVVVAYVTVVRFTGNKGIKEWCRFVPEASSEIVVKIIKR